MTGRDLGCRRQRGGAAVEFAFVFPVLFMLIYGVIVYSYLFLLKESLAFAAQEAAQAAVAVDPDENVNPDFDAVATRVARARAVSVLGWLPEDQKRRVIGSAGEAVAVTFRSAPDGGSTVIVTLNFDVARGAPLFPVLDLFLVGRVPPLPETLVARAEARV